MKSLFILAGILSVQSLWAKPYCESPPTDHWEDIFQKTPRERDLLLKKDSCRDLGGFLGFEAGAAELHSDSFAVFYRGKLLFSKDKPPFTFMTPHPLWSASKSISSAVIGAALEQVFKDKSLDLASKLVDFLDAENSIKKNDRRFKNFSQISLENLLNMSSGFQWSEAYDAGAAGSSVLDMIYLNPERSMTAYALSRPMGEYEPGAIFNYSSGDMMLAQTMLKKACAQQKNCQYDKLPWQVLFDQIGARNVAFEQDKDGVFVGASYVHMSSFDMGRIGQLFLCDGKWGKKQILPETWVTETRKVNSAYLNQNTVITDILAQGVYGRSWWLNQKVPEKNIQNPTYPSFPEDMFAAMGHYGQFIFIIPSQDLVIVRTGSDLSYNKKVNALGEKIYACLAEFVAVTKLKKCCVDFEKPS